MEGGGCRCTPASPFLGSEASTRPFWRPGVGSWPALVGSRSLATSRWVPGPVASARAVEMLWAQVCREPPAWLGKQAAVRWGERRPGFSPLMSLFVIRIDQRPKAPLES